MEKYKGIVMGLDVDGTIFTHEYPAIGKPLPNCIEVLKRFIVEGGKICLNTMRSGKELEEAVQYLKDNGIECYGVNKNPTQYRWTQSPKVYANIYVDDAAIGCPTLYDPSFSDRKYVDWFGVEALLLQL